MLSSGDGVNGFRSTSCKCTASFMNKPEYECAELLQRCLNEGMIAVALKSNIEIGSPKYLILSGDVLVSDVILLEKSVETFLPISAPTPVTKPPSQKPTAESTAVPMANPPATPVPTTYFVVNSVFFYNGDCISPLTTGAPNDLDCIIP